MIDHADEEPEDGAPGQAGEGGERVAKALARAGVASRRDVERFIAAGRVALNGQVLDTPAVKVGPGDILTVDGQVVDGPEPTRVWRHHKPAGLLTSHGDPQGRPTVFEHLPPGLPRVISVGRLDLASEGLLLLTNDGELARALELPANAWTRTYRARAYGRADQARLDTLKAGVTVEGVRYGPIEARLDKATGAGAVGRGRVSDAPANLWITVTVEEGKNREVRRVLESLGLKVNRLIRLAYGPFALGDLPLGAVEEVGPRVLREQLAGLIPPERMPRGDRRPAPPVRAQPSRREPAKPSHRATRLDPPERPNSRPGKPGKPGPRPSGAAGRVAQAWTPPGERKGPARPGAPRKPAGRAGPGGPSGPGASAKPAGAWERRPGGKAAAASGPGRPRPGAPPGEGRERPPGAKPGRPPERADARPARGPGPLKPTTRASSKPPAKGPPGPAAARGGAAERKPTGLELTPEMRRTFRKPGAKRPPRPPRKD